MVIWTIFYYFKLVTIPPLRIAIMSTLLFSSFLLIHYKVPLCYIILSGIIHSLPLAVLPNRKDYETSKRNILVFVIYLLYAIHNKVIIIKDYEQFALFFQKNPSIEQSIQKILL